MMFKILLITGAVLFFTFLAEGRRELKFFKVKRYRLSVPKLKGLDSPKKVIILADLHNKVYGDDNSELIGAISQENPDLILIAGDMLVGKDEIYYKEALDFVRALPAICPVYYSLGNHEQRLKVFPEKYKNEIYKEYREKLIESGVHLLENASADCMLDRLKVVISGLELPMDTYEKFKKHVVKGRDIGRCLGKCDREKFQILLAHNPVFFPAYKEWGADLTVSGHLHGGIIRIPGLGGMITPQAALFPKYSGEMSVEDNQTIIVSKGLGTHTVNLRFCNYAEIIALEMIP